MDHRAFTLETGEIWVRQGRQSHTYSQQLSYALFRSVSGRAVHLRDNIVEAILQSCYWADFQFVDGFSIATDCHKIIFSNAPLIVASRGQ